MQNIDTGPNSNFSDSHGNWQVSETLRPPPSVGTHDGVLGLF